MKRTLVLDVVGLSPRLLGEHTPSLNALVKRGGSRPLGTVTPAVTCSAQATFLTGELPTKHGVVANGWYYRDTAEVALWKQSNALVQGEKVWEAAKQRNPSFTCAQLFWWFNMYAAVDFAVTPRPQYPADGRKVPDIHTHPAALRDELLGQLGPFPLFKFWGPAAGLEATRWIADCAKHVFISRKPDLTLVYLPHLDYDLQRYGPGDPRIGPQLKAVDAICGELIDLADRAHSKVVVLSEYGITPVTGPVHINRALREAKLLAVRREDAGEQLDAGASEAFAVADHQLAHVYVKRMERTSDVKALLEKLDGVEAVWDAKEQLAHGLGHPRSGELVALSRADRWFTYYHWLDDALAPDWARTVDIHRKPGYDPVELFFDPGSKLVKAKAALRLAQRKLGFRALLDVIGLDASVVKGSHGRITDSKLDGPIFITSAPQHLPQHLSPVAATEVKQLLLQHVFDE